MTPKIKTHLGTILTAIAAIGHELMGAGEEQPEIPPGAEEARLASEATRAGGTGETATSAPVVKRTRRTKAQIEADLKAAEAIAAQQPATTPPAENTATVPVPTPERSGEVEDALLLVYKANGFDKVDLEHEILANPNEPVVDNFKALHYIIRPAVKNTKGEKVKELINKYLGIEQGGNLTKLAEKPETHAAFYEEVKKLYPVKTESTDGY